ncbi:MAG: hypothetical protein IJO79_00675 [Firmicutes bacterium]|nr:hypothetical protein [Bacillota bacterium]
MSKYIINILDGEEEVRELEGTRVIAAVGYEEGMTCCCGHGTEEDEVVRFAMDIRNLLAVLEREETAPFMAGLLTFANKKERTGTDPEEAN